jgi:hypothetical protein
MHPGKLKPVYRILTTIKIFPYAPPLSYFSLRFDTKYLIFDIMSISMLVCRPHDQDKTKNPVP